VTNCSFSSRIPVTICDGRDWYDGGPMDLPLNGPHSGRSWRMDDQYLSIPYTPGCDRSRKHVSPLQAFMAVFPKKQLNEMVERTNLVLTGLGEPKTTKGEVLKWFGVLILMTRFEFGERSSLWTDSNCKYIPSPRFGRLMVRDRWDSLYKHLVWSLQPAERPEDMSCENYRWRLVEDFVENINEHRRRYFHPSYAICVDESMIRWYGLGGSWINMGMPMYVSIQRKPEDGLEIHDSCCGKCRIMMHLRLVKSAEADLE
jgi:hypothetical protein